jgi:hypothetical protein
VRTTADPFGRMGNGALYGISAALLVHLTGAHRTTAARWKRNPRIARWLERLVRVCHQGELGEIDSTWSGWRLEGGELVSPEGWRFTPGQIRVIPFLHAQIRTLRAERRVALQADWIDQRYVEAEATSCEPARVA